ncbi:MAG: 16S rRNA (adenine(1518)-N(6)/adenine(1519)-N(6))-dimethyltransferase RsmA [Verrucomicrobiales bacterium]
MKLSEMRDLLSSRQIQLTKSLGQNFLHDQNQLKRIADLAVIKPGDKLLEIGPGLGPLTEVLLETGVDVVAIEKDRRLFEVLEERFKGRKNLKLLLGDGLRYVEDNQQWSGWKLVANLPYSVASPILVEMSLSEAPPEMCVATLQIEVAQRIIAKPGTEQYGQLSLFMQATYLPGDWFRISAESFFPQPEVDSACIALRKRPSPLLQPSQIATFKKVVKRSFSERRKMMLKLLKNDWPAEALLAAFAANAIPVDIRAERISLEQFVGLTRALQPTS